MISKRYVPIFALGLVFAAACGSADGPKKKSSNNGVANNGGGNNGSNNGTSNNGANNGGSNNGGGNNGSNNGTTSLDACLDFPDSLNFGVVETGNSSTRILELFNCGTEAVTISDVTTSDAFLVLESLPGTLEPGAGASSSIEFAPSVAGDVAGQLQLSTSVGTITIDLLGVGSTTTVDPECPNSVAQVMTDAGASSSHTAPVGTTVELTALGSSSNSGQIQRYEWSLVQRPANSTSRLTPSATDAEPMLLLDLAGTYQVQVNAFVDGQPADCTPGVATITAVQTSSDEITVQLTWDTPNDADQTDTLGTDMDLHYLDSIGNFNASPYDVYWQNPDVDWGVKGQASVDIDDTDGAGPEVISHRNASTGLFRIGAYYYSDNGFGASSATLRLYRDGLLLAEYKDQDIESQGKFWEAATFDVSNDAVTNVGAITDNFPN